MKNFLLLIIGKVCFYIGPCRMITINDVFENELEESSDEI